MPRIDRREFAFGALAAGALGLTGAASAGKSIRVLVWDERQPAQKEAYANFLGNAVADHLRSKGGEFEVRSVGLDDPQQGLTPDVLDATDVLIWWGHQRHAEVRVETGKMLVERVRSGKLSLLALHSAHWSVPFIEAMNSRTVDDALASLSKEERAKAKVHIIETPKRGLMAKGENPVPTWTKKVGADGSIDLEVKMPSCVFYVVRNDGKPSHLTTLQPKHPIAKGVPATFDIPQTEVYGGPFGVPKPDATIFDEKWDSGETFPAGCYWKLGKGQVFYFRPGHETYPIFKQEVPLRIVENAVRFLARKH